MELKPLVLSALKPALNPTVVVDGSGLQKVTDFISRVSVLGLDTETNVTNRFYNRQLRTIQIGDRNEQYIIDLLPFVDGNSELLVSAQRDYGKNLTPGLRAIADTLRPALDSKSHLKVGMNLQFEYEMLLWNLGIRTWNNYGIDLVDKVLEAGNIPLFMKGVFNLEGIVARRLKYQITKDEQKTFNHTDPLTENQIVYAALDIRLPLAVKNVQADLLTKANLWRAAQIENEAIPAFGDMRLNGVIIDKEKWLALYEAVKDKHKANVRALDEFFVPVVGKKIVTPQAELDAMEAEVANLREPQQDELDIRVQIDAAVGNAAKKPLRDLRNAMAEARKARKNELNDRFKFLKTKAKEAIDYEGEAAINYASPDQLYEVLTGGEFKGINKTTLKSTDDDALNKLAKKFPVCAALQEYRTTDKHKKSYGPGWVLPQGENGENEFAHPDFKKKIKHWLDPVTLRVHSSINQMGADTGRTSSSKPNIQNVTHEAPIFEQDQLRLGYGSHDCFIAPPGYTTITMDMSGAELRIIADMSGAKVWVDAFNNKEDVHSISTEILYPEEWRNEAEPGCWYYLCKTPELTADEGLLKKILQAMFINREEWDKIPDGKQLKLKCKCKDHKPRRNDCKTCNFLLAYKGSARSLAMKIGKSEEVCQELMGNHERRFGEVWSWLKMLGDRAKQLLESRTFSGRRRLFKRPEWKDAKPRADKKAQERYGREAVSRDVSRELAAMYGSIDREGTNAPVQGGNADVAKTAMGSGFCKNGKPFMWHLLPKFGALLSNFIHDEFVVWVPNDPEIVKACVEAMGDCIRRAGAEFMKRVVMEFEYNVAPCWKK